MVVTEVIEAKKKGEDYPKLMRSNSTIVLFESSHAGCVVASDVHTIGHYSEDWAMGAFEDFHGSVMLTNED